MAVAHAHAGHDPAAHPADPSHGVLQHHFDSLEQQRDASSLGMWAFVVQEALFFGGLFTAYLIYRYLYPQAFYLGSNQLDIVLGGVNTAILIGSSLTMALAVWAAQTGHRRQLVGYLTATLVLGCAFLVIKYFEYAEKFHHHLVPGAHFQFDGAEAGHVELFFSLYFAMTGMHAIHMIIGAAILVVYIVMAARGKFTPAYSHPVELFGLYWHFVDIVWIFLFPLLYLLGRN